MFDSLGLRQLEVGQAQDLPLQWRDSLKGNPCGCPYYYSSNSADYARFQDLSGLKFIVAMNCIPDRN